MASILELLALADQKIKNTVTPNSITPGILGTLFDSLLTELRNRGILFVANEANIPDNPNDGMVVIAIGEKSIWFWSTDHFEKLNIGAGGGGEVVDPSFLLGQSNYWANENTFQFPTNFNAAASFLDFANMEGGLNLHHTRFNVSGLHDYDSPTIAREHLINYGVYCINGFLRYVSPDIADDITAEARAVTIKGVFADNTEALAGGLVVGECYRAGDFVKVVHEADGGGNSGGENHVFSSVFEPVFS